MPDTYTSVSSQGFISRILGSFVGFLLGPVLIIVAIVLLSWNEGRAVQAIRGLSEAASVAVEASDLNAGNQGKLVHVIGPATAETAISDPDLGLNFDKQVAVARNAEMYQWSEKEDQETHDKLGGGQETVTTYTYEKVWSSNRIDSGSFKHQEGHENPDMSVVSTRYAADDAKLNGYTLSADTLGRISLENDLRPTAPDGWTQTGNKIYKGANPASPQIGDLRVGYQGLASGATISILAQQSQGGFAPFTTSNGYQLDMAEVGNQPLENMITEQRNAESMMTWILRVVGLFVMFFGFFLLLNPLATIASVVPFLGSIVGGAAGLAAFVVSLPLTIIVIALSWIAFRPLLGIGLLVVAAGLLYVLRRWHHSTHPPVTAPVPKHA